MKFTSSLFATLLTLACMSTNACSAPAENPKPLPATNDCAQSSRILTAVEHKDVGAINQAISILPCYKGGEASSIDVALGNMITDHPEKILSAMHTNHISKIEISDIAANQPWHLVDHFCGLLDELNLRISALTQVKKYDRERQIAIDAIKHFKSEVALHCKKQSPHQH